MFTRTVSFEFFFVHTHIGLIMFRVCDNDVTYDTLTGLRRKWCQSRDPNGRQQRMRERRFLSRDISQPSSYRDIQFCPPPSMRPPSELNWSRLSSADYGDFYLIHDWDDMVADDRHGFLSAVTYTFSSWPITRTHRCKKTFFLFWRAACICRYAMHNKC